MEEILILVKKTNNGGYRAAIYQSGHRANQKQEFAETPKEALRNLIENHIV